MILEQLLVLVSRKDGPRVFADSRLVKKGDIFVAVKGTHVDGHNFIAAAVKQGAKYIVAQKGAINPDIQKGNSSCEFIEVENPAKAAAILAQAQKGNPASKMTNLAVTGTNGKTTVAYLVRSIINGAGFRCGLMGTVEYDTGKQIFQSKLTTPDCFTIADIAGQMVDSGAKYMVMEASSHSIDQDRIEGISFKAAAFTNLTGDHLDYHKTKDSYLAAKTKLFEGLQKHSLAILNKQSPESFIIAAKTKAEILWYSVDEPADITAYIESMDISGTAFELAYKGQSEKIKTVLVGKYNVSNCLAAAGLCLAAGFDLKTIAAGLSAFKSVPGRLQRVGFDGDFTVLVDYAHTDDALKNVLETLKPICRGKLIAVFGCGGDRDRTKRPRMAKVTEKYADLIIVTSDNPRSENPQKIIEEIITGFEKQDSKKIFVEPDRKAAIKLAIESAGKNDIVLIAGKGHENYQILGDKTIHFSDEETASEFLKKK